MGDKFKLSKIKSNFYDVKAYIYGSDHRKLFWK